MKDIPGYEGLYACTNDGRIWTHYNNRFLVLQSSDKAGHYHVTLSKHGEVRTWGVHQLVLLTYVGPPPIGMEVLHRDGNSRHNQLSNLVYDTHQANMLQHSRDKPDTHVKGERVNTAKLTAEGVIHCRKAYEDGATIASLAKLYSVTQTAMGNIVHRKTWKHVGG